MAIMHLNPENEFGLKNLFDRNHLLVKNPPLLKVRDIMDEEKVKIFENDPVIEVIRLMTWESILHACIFNENEELVGVINLNDLKKTRNKNTLVKDVMHRNFHKILGCIDAEIGIEIVNHEPDHCLPVIEDGVVTGILCVDNIESFLEIYQ